jgi:Enoyl-(Acyl carrier protein) reductase
MSWSRFSMRPTRRMRARHCREVIKKAVDDLGGIDILVNNAAHQATFKDTGDISDEEWEMTFRTNIHAMFYLTKAAVPHMKPGSAIINTASVNSDMPNPMLLAYATTKGAIQNFTGGLAQMLAEKGIRANAVAPGPIWTPLIPSTMPDEAVKNFGKQTPMKRPGQPGRTRERLRHARGPPLQLHFRHHGSGHRRQAVHLMAGLKHPVTPDGRYFVVRGRLWRLSNPHLSAAARAMCVQDLMAARRAVKLAKAAGDQTAEAAAHLAVDIAKRKLGERGEVWWTDGSPDLNRHVIKNTSYSAWYSNLKKAARRGQRLQFTNDDRYQAKERVV